MASGAACGAVLLIAGIALEVGLVCSYISRRRVGATTHRSPFVALLLLVPGAFMATLPWSTAAQQWLLAGVCLADLALWSVVGLMCRRHPPEHPEIQRRIARERIGHERRAQGESTDAD